MEIEIKIQKVIFGGDGLGWHEGKTCLVQGALPNELLRVAVVDPSKKVLRATILKIIEASPMRQDPQCKYTSHCGGCQYQHIDYDSELRLKTQQVQEAFAHEFKCVELPTIKMEGCFSEYRYRNQVALHMQHSGKPQSRRIGFLAKDNVTPVIVDDCLLVNESLKSVFVDKYVLSKGNTHIQFRLDQDQRIVSSQKDTFNRMRVGDQMLWASSAGFFQNNLDITSKLVQYVTSWLRQNSSTDLIDLYCGGGLFSILARPHDREVLFFESNPANIECLRLNIKESGLEKYRVFKGKVEKQLPKFLQQCSETAYSCLIDPPRQGMSQPIRGCLIGNSNIKRIFYLSCNLSTLIRDLKDLVNQGNYVIKTIQPYDMFPRTKHIEIAVTLDRQ